MTAVGMRIETLARATSEEERAEALRKPNEVVSPPSNVAMRERAETAGGWCRTTSSPGSGTLVEFWVPATA